MYIGFDYEFDSLHTEGNELSVAFSSLVSGESMSAVRRTIEPILMAFAPALLRLVRVLFFPFTNLR